MNMNESQLRTLIRRELIRESKYTKTYKPVPGFEDDGVRILKDIVKYIRKNYDVKTTGNILDPSGLPNRNTENIYGLYVTFSYNSRKTQDYFTVQWVGFRNEKNTEIVGEPVLRINKIGYRLTDDSYLSRLLDKEDIPRR